MKKEWSENEVKLLNNLYCDLGYSLNELYPIFLSYGYDRTRDSVLTKIKRLGLKHSKEQTKKIKSRIFEGEKNPMFGKKPWSKGLTKETSNKIKHSSKKISETRKSMYKNGELPSLKGDKNPMFGKKPWNIGLTKYGDKIIDEASKKQSKTMKDKWLNMSNEDKEKIITQLNSAMIQTKKPTKIENKVKLFLDEKGLKYTKNKKMYGFYVDFYLDDYNLIIECDGDYWHCNPKIFNGKKLTKSQKNNIDRDGRKKSIMVENGVKLLRFWEDDIHNNFKMVTQTIEDNINHQRIYNNA